MSWMCTLNVHRRMPALGCQCGRFAPLKADFHGVMQPPLWCCMASPRALAPLWNQVCCLCVPPIYVHLNCMCWVVIVPRCMAICRPPFPPVFSHVGGRRLPRLLRSSWSLLLVIAYFCYWSSHTRLQALQLLARAFIVLHPTLLLCLPRAGVRAALCDRRGAHKPLMAHTFHFFPCSYECCIGWWFFEFCKLCGHAMLLPSVFVPCLIFVVVLGCSIFSVP